LQDTLRFLQTRADEHGGTWSCPRKMTLLGQMNWGSLEVVPMAKAAQQHYRQQFPFEELFTEISMRELKVQD
jgi:hypothetical protein